jgi:chromosome partitioning protein
MLMTEPLTVVLACQKGGVGKTSTCVHLAYAWAQKLGCGSVQLIDRDHQKSAARFLPQMPQVMAHDADSVRVRLIDTPPTLGIELSDSLREADHVVVPINSFAAMEGLKGLEETMQKIRAQRLTPFAVHYLATMQHPTAKSSELVQNTLRTRYRTQVLTATVRKSDAFESGWIMKQTVFEYAPKSAAAQQMQAVCDELFNRLKLQESEPLWP